MGSSASGQFLVDRLPLCREPAVIHCEEDFALVLKMLIESPGRISCFLGDAIGISAVVPELVKKRRCAVDDALSRLLRRTPPRAAPARARFLSLFQFFLDSHR